MNTPLNDALKPCPFCGSRNVSHSSGIKGNGDPWPYVECDDCSACAEPELWNTRANTPASSAAQGAMTLIDKDDLRNILDDLRKGCISAHAVLTLEDWLHADLLVQPSDATAQGKARNFCADCGKRTPEGSIHTCAPAYAVEQAEHIVDANKMVPTEPSAAMLDAAVAFALNVSLHSGYGWTDYMRDLWKVMIQANQREAHISHNSAHNDAAKKG